MTGVLQHAGGALSTLMMSFDTWAARLPRIEVYGSAGTLSVPDPNHFDGEVSVFVAADGAWRAVPPSAGYVGAGRGSACSTWPRRWPPVRGTGAPSTSPSTCSTSWSPCSMASTTGAAVTVGSTCQVPRPVAGLVDLVR